MNQDQPERPGGPGQRPQFSWRLLIPLLVVILLLPFIFDLFQGRSGGQEIAYTRFKDLVRSGQISSVIVQGDRISGGLPGSQPTMLGASDQFVTYVPVFGDDELLPLLRENNVEITVRPDDQMSFLGIILSLLPYVFMVWIFFALFRNIRGQNRGIFQVGENKAKLYDEKREKTTFDDVAGLEGPKEEVTEIVDFLKHPERYESLGARTPKGLLLVGPPGTGKTLIARAIAGEAGVAFFSMSGSDFMEMFVGVGASRVRNLFTDAKKRGSAIIFIDELDSIGRHRGAGLGGGHDEREQTLNQLLSELDGFEPNEGIVVVAATNRPDILDPALLRPGRFDRRVTIPMPTKDERVAILKVHAKNKPLDGDVDLDAVAGQTTGFSGADLQNLLNESALFAARRRAKTITGNDIENSRDRIIMGLERKGMHITDEERRVIAYHEAGHAIAAAVLPHADPIFKVTIVPRGMAMGVTHQQPSEDRYVYSREYLEDRICVMLGGRASEIIVLDTMTSGAENDLKEATKLVRRMIVEWGMSEAFANTALGDGQRNVFLGEQISQQRSYSEDTARQIDEEIRRLLKQTFERTMEVLNKHREALDTLAARLLEQEIVSGGEVLAMVGKGKE